MKEVKGGRAEVLGVNIQLEDAHLQQFIKGKVQRPIEFSYRAMELEGKTIGVIQIPCQKRPFHTRMKYGAVEKDVFYIRRGSSTGTASPDEIASMGADHLATAASKPLLSLNLLDKASGQTIGTSADLNGIALNGPQEEDIPDYSEQRSPFDLRIGSINENYYRELVNYTTLRLLLQTVSFAVTNAGDAAALDVRVMFDIHDPRSRGPVGSRSSGFGEVAGTFAASGSDHSREKTRAGRGRSRRERGKSRHLWSM